VRSRRSEQGFTLVEVIVAMAILSLIATGSMGGLLGAMTEARRGFIRAQAAAWVQSELDFLRVQGYGIETGSRLIPDPANADNDPATGYLPDYGTALSEPRVPQGFYQAQIDVVQVVGLPLKQLSVRLYQTPGAPPYTILVTYVSQFSYP
jgi:prepilin-type N-terminal cleavage/methylation domain-containing protein